MNRLRQIATASLLCIGASVASAQGELTLPHYVRLNYSGHSEKYTALENDGFFGMGVKDGAEYRFSVWARTPQGGNGQIAPKTFKIYIFARN